MAEKTYRAIRHKIKRDLQFNNCDTLHHPDQKINQIKKTLIPNTNEGERIKVLELFSGHGNLTKLYAQYGEVYAHEYKGKVFDKLIENTKGFRIQHHKIDSFIHFHTLIGQKKKFNVIDLDSYGFPNRFFPDIFLLMDEGVMYVTMPRPYVNVLNGMTQTHLTSYYGKPNPSQDEILERIVLWGLCHWRKVELIDSIDLKSVWRFAFKIAKIKATEYTGVKNR
jgi:tRNA G26 N,N-dimethylase Trm1